MTKPESPDWRLRGIAGRIAIHSADLANASQIDALIREVRPEWVFHLAAHGAYSFQHDTVEMARTNFLGTVVLAQACIKVGVKVMVNIGSSSEYGFKDHAPSEDETLEPNSDYAMTKAAATQFCAYTARRHQFPIPTLRLYSVYGPYEEPRRLIPSLVMRAMEGGFPPLVAASTCRDFVHVDDACDAMIALAN